MDIQISADELRQASANMKSAIRSMKDELDTASNVMTRTSDSFESRAGDVFREKYNELKGKFDLFYNEMTSYAEFLDKTAAEYEHTDKMIETAADDMLSE